MGQISVRTIKQAVYADKTIALWVRHHWAYHIDGVSAISYLFTYKCISRFELDKDNDTLGGEPLLVITRICGCG